MARYININSATLIKVVSKEGTEIEPIRQIEYGLYRILNPDEEKEIESQLYLLQEMEKIEWNDFDDWLHLHTGIIFREHVNILEVIKAYLESKGK
jgi:hypothetical protein